MTDESEAGRRARAPPPRPSVRPEPRPRTVPPRLIRPSEHLAMVEQARERRPPPLMPSVTVLPGPSRTQSKPLPVQNQRPSSVVQAVSMQPTHTLPVQAIQVPQAMQGTIQMHPSIKMQGSRPPPPPPVPRPYVPPPTRMPAPMAVNPVMRLPQPRRDIQVGVLCYVVRNINALG